MADNLDIPDSSENSDSSDNADSTQSTEGQDQKPLEAQTHEQPEPEARWPPRLQCHRCSQCNRCPYRAGALRRRYR